VIENYGGQRETVPRYIILTIKTIAYAEGTNIRKDKAVPIILLPSIPATQPLKSASLYFPSTTSSVNTDR
jgi:hypothetical protein